VNERDEVIVTTVRVRPDVWRALRRLAETRALADGGKPSVSGAITALVEAEERRRTQGAPDRA